MSNSQKVERSRPRFKIEPGTETTVPEGHIVIQRSHSKAPDGFETYPLVLPLVRDGRRGFFFPAKLTKLVRGHSVARSALVVFVNEKPSPGDTVCFTGIHKTPGGNGRHYAYATVTKKGTAAA